MTKTLLLTALLTLSLSAEAAKPRITGGNLPPVPSKPRVTGGPLPPQWVEWFVCGPRMPAYVRKYCHPV